MSSPRVLFVTGEYPPLRGGVADYTALLRQALHDQGVESIVLSDEGSEGDGVYTIGNWSWPIALHIREIVQRDPVDLVHIQYQAGAFDMHPAINALPTALGAWMRMPVVTTFHDLRVPYLFPKAGRLRQAVMLRMARASTQVVVTNPGDERILQDAEIPTRRIALGPNLPVPRAGCNRHLDSTIGFFGFPSREKGIVELIRAIGMFPDSTRPPLKLVGASRPDTGTHEFVADQEIDEIARQNKVDLQRTGYLPPQEASDQLARSSVISLPFEHGASQRSGALIAALSMGRPVVTTADVVRDDLDGLADLPQLLRIAARDTNELYAVLEDARSAEVPSKPLPDGYQWPAIAAQHTDLYRSLIERRSR
ncbi:MAG: glycosyltransferase [Chloroflexota bacterium]